MAMHGYVGLCTAVYGSAGACIAMKRCLKIKRNKICYWFVVCLSWTTAILLVGAIPVNNG